MGCNNSKSSTTNKNEKTAAERKVAWAKIKARIPRGKNAADKERRIALWKQFDKSGNGKLTFDEAYVGCKDILELGEFTNRLRDIVKRAFNKAKDMGNKAEGTGSSEFVEFLEFRLMLCYIYDLFELTVMFDEIDTSGNGLIDLKELKKAQPKIREWGLEFDDAETVFKSLDENGSGSITFDEFAQWAADKKLDADGDPDNLA